MQNLYRGEYKPQQQQNNNFVTFIAAKFDYIVIESLVLKIQRLWISSKSIA